MGINLELEKFLGIVEHEVRECCSGEMASLETAYMQVEGRDFDHYHLYKQC